MELITWSSTGHKDNEAITGQKSILEIMDALNRFLFLVIQKTQLSAASGLFYPVNIEALFLTGNSKWSLTIAFTAYLTKNSRVTIEVKSRTIPMLYCAPFAEYRTSEVRDANSYICWRPIIHRTKLLVSISRECRFGEHKQLVAV